MMERIAVCSRQELLMRTLTNLIQEVVAKEAENYNILIAEVYAELLRDQLVQSAESGLGLAHPESLISISKAVLETLLKTRLGDIQLNYLSRYKGDICKELKVPAKELLVLQEKLQEARRRGELPIDDPIEQGEQGQFRISEVGVKGNEIQGLIASPSDDHCYLDFSQVMEICTVQGDWFPVELVVKDAYIGELVFVVDQDGSIHIPTEHFSTEILSRTRDILSGIAGRLYVESERSDYKPFWVEE